MDKALQRVNVGANVSRAVKTNLSIPQHLDTAHPFSAYPATPGEHPIWRIPTPSLILSPARAVENFQAIQRAFPGATVGYAMKSNPHPALLAALARLDDAWFEVASQAEIQALLDIGVPGERIFFSNPVKQPAHIAFAVRAGIRLFAYDSEHEVEKLARFNAPADPLQVYVRMTVTHEGALWPLTHKFGVEPRRAVALLKLAEARGLRPVGLAFHVGSQCVRPDTWADALRQIAPAWTWAREAGLALDLVDIGGGFPAPYTGPTPSPHEIAAAVYSVLETATPGARRLFLEPGRGVSGTAADMVLEITGLAQRPDGQTWLYVDGGYFSGLYEIPDGIRPAVQPVIRESRPLGMRTYRLAGPTCDSLDTLFEMRSPVELKPGDRLVLKTAGAYVYSVSSPFNGFPLPEVLHEDEWMLDLDAFHGIC